MAMMNTLFARLRDRPKVWRNLFFVVLALLVGLNFLILPEEAHFGWDALPGFFAVFGLITGALLVLILDKIVRPLIARKEDFYGDL
jgi:hypothetical protein